MLSLSVTAEKTSLTELYIREGLGFYMIYAPHPDENFTVL